MGSGKFLKQGFELGTPAVRRYIQFKIICISLFTIQPLQSSFTGNYVSTIDLYIAETEYI